MYFIKNQYLKINSFLFNKQQHIRMPSVVADIYNSSTQETETGKLSWIWGQSGLHSELREVCLTESLKLYVKKKTHPPTHTNKQANKISLNK